MASDLNRIDIGNFLPHKFPLLLVDRILEISNHKVKSCLTIPPYELFVQDNVFSEFGMIENAAQTCSSVVGRSYFFGENTLAVNNNNVIGFISAVKNIHISSLPLVGNQIITDAELLSKMDMEKFILCNLKCKTWLEDKLLMESNMNLIIVEQL